MQRNHFSNLEGMALPLLGFGAMRFPTREDGKIDRPRVQEMVDYAMSHGLNYFDTAYYYHEGESEPVLREVLKKYPRESYFLTDKMPYLIWRGPDPGKEMRKIFEYQMKTCDVEYFDFYLFHSFQKRIFEVSKSVHAYEYLKEQQLAGHIKKIGFSFHGTPEVLKEILDEYEWDVVQLQLNFHDWDFVRIKEMYELCEQRNIPVFVMGPVRGGNLMKFSTSLEAELAEKYPGRSLASWALRWAASLPNVKLVNSGMSNMDQLKDNLHILIENFEPMNDEDLAIVERLRKDFAKNTIVPCTGCGYCMDCPGGVDIPRVFAILNDSERVADPFHAQLNYSRHLPKENRVNHCIKCGACSPKCPQNIDIPTALYEAHEKLYLESITE